MIKVAKEFVGEVYFAVSSKAEMGAELQQFGIEPTAEIGVGLFDSKGFKYAMTEKFRLVNNKHFNPVLTVFLVLII